MIAEIQAINLRTSGRKATQTTAEEHETDGNIIESYQKLENIEN